ncbi:MAG TPA: AAA family ATPase [Coriobacteriia bacterium]|nr:AAA family ATPase [Coriobacteriia bacterium]
MRFTSVRLQNYRQYRDVTLTFGASSGVSVIVGKTGSGKTNLLNALTWCLYDEEAFGAAEEATRASRKSNKGMPLANIGPLGEQLQQGPLECVVELGLVDDDGRKAVIRREAAYVVNAEGVPERQGGSQLSVLRQNGASGYDRVEDPDHWISRRLPKHIRPYYMLNTERLNQFFHQGAESKRVRQAILEIAKINTLDRMKTRLRQVRDELLSAVGRSDKGGLLEGLENERVELDHRIEVLSSQIDSKTLNLESLERQMDALNDRMGDVDKASKAIADYNGVRERLQRLDEELEELDERMYSRLVTSAPAVLCYGAVSDLVLKVDEAWKAGRIPAPIHPDFVQELLNSHLCVCGRGLEADTIAREQVEDLLERHREASQLGAFLQAQRGPAAVLRRRAVDLETDLEPIRLDIRDKETQRDGLRKRLEVLEQELNALGVEDDLFQVLKAQWDAAVRQRDALTAEIPRLESKRESLQEDLGKVRKNIEREMKRRSDQQEHYKLLEFAEQCLAAVDHAHSELITETRLEVSSALNDSFLRMIWKDQTYVAASIDQDYGVGVEMAKGYDAAADLSGGEDVCLALSFSQALGRVSDFDVPLVFDSPLVKVDDEVKVLVAQTMLKNLNGRQLILLMKPDEFGAVESTFVESGVSSVVRIEFDEAAQSTTVVI